MIRIIVKVCNTHKKEGDVYASPSALLMNFLCTAYFI